MDKIDNPFKQFLDERIETPHSFARRSQMNEHTVYRIYKGTKPQRRTAREICKWSNKKLTMKDFGFE